ncbi:MAG: biotin/lipoyl-containing protein, partial [Gammaproteobacteria bacterium]|nr:biotin/lipoyl-containing protein [Gammaproteobacteria bacterium]
VIVNVNVLEGQQVNQGDPLLSIEAMKMETVLHAERSGSVEKIVAPAGTQVDSRDLLLIMTD